MSEPPLVVMMGVSGSGKTTVGEVLAEKLGVEFRDADSFHPKSNVEKMSAGIPLTDDDRWPWLDAIGEALRDAPATGLVVSCSALRRVYRERILKRAGREVHFVHLDGSKALLAERLKTRKGHFFPPSLLDSQIKTLEPLSPDEPAIRVSIEPSVEEIVAEIEERLHLRAARA